MRGWLGRLAMITTVVLVCFGCTEKDSGKGKPLAKVGEYVFTEKEFRERAAEWAYFQGIGALSQERRRALLEQEIDKEVLIQEAVKRGLHEDDSFRRTIENYWEQTLLTALLKEINQTLKDTVIVTSEEVKERYLAQTRGQADPPPFEEVKKELEREIIEEKKTAALEVWIKSLRAGKKIVVYEDNLKALR